MLLIVAQPASAACTPPIEVSPASGVPGASITISGTGWDPLTIVDVFFDSLFLESIQVDFSGSWTVEAVVPDLDPGTYPLRYAANPSGAGLPMFFCDETDFSVMALLVVTPTTTATPPPTTTTTTTTPPPATTTAPPPATTEAATTTTFTTTDTSVAAADAETSGGGNSTLVGVLIGLAVAVALGGAWVLGRRSAASADDLPPPPPP
jgi:hypothetical protein